MKGKWEVTDERPGAYESDWVTVDQYDVKLPDGEKMTAHIAKCGEGGVKVLVHDDEKGVLALWRHRITGDQWGWELPGGRVEKGESAADAGAREVLEETGWKPARPEKLLTVQPLPGVVDHPTHLMIARGAEWVEPPEESNEAADISWIPVSQILEIIDKGEMADGPSCLAVLLATQRNEIRS